LTLEGFQPGTIGSAGRGICQGPGLVQTDLSLYRNTRISDRVKARLRFEMFNIFNNTNFLSNTGFNTTFDLTTATYDADSADATTIPGYTFSLNFGQASAARDARQAQFGIELIQDFVVKEDGRPREIAPAAGEEQEEPRRTEELEHHDRVDRIQGRGIEPKEQRILVGRDLPRGLAVGPSAPRRRSR
jgi:hypothetical protein